MIGRYVLTQDIFDKINTHKVSYDEIHLTNALKRLDVIYGVEAMKWKAYTYQEVDIMVYKNGKMLKDTQYSTKVYFKEKGK